MPIVCINLVLGFVAKYKSFSNKKFDYDHFIFTTNNVYFQSKCEDLCASVDKLTIKNSHFHT